MAKRGAMLYFALVAVGALLATDVLELANRKAKRRRVLSRIGLRSR